METWYTAEVLLCFINHDTSKGTIEFTSPYADQVSGYMPPYSTETDLNFIPSIEYL